MCHLSANNKNKKTRCVCEIPCSWRGQAKGHKVVNIFVQNQVTASVKVCG